MSDFKREDRYLVFKRCDIENVLNDAEHSILARLAKKVALGRDFRGARPLTCVVVEDDWPEYEQVWHLIEQRVTKNE